MDMFQTHKYTLPPEMQRNNSIRKNGIYLPYSRIVFFAFLSEFINTLVTFDKSMAQFFFQSSQTFLISLIPIFLKKPNDELFTI